MTAGPINAGILLCDQTPELLGAISGYTSLGRSLELIRLGSVAPQGCSGYVSQIASGTRRVRIDAMRQLRRAGVEFTTDPYVLQY